MHGSAAPATESWCIMRKPMTTAVLRRFHRNMHGCGRRFAALTSTNGAFRFANGVEWICHGKKLTCMNLPPFGTGALSPNQVDHDQPLNTILAGASRISQRGCRELH